MLRWFWVGLAAGCFIVPAFAAQPSFRADPMYLIDIWETGEGLPENSATAMVQTPDGYLWFGTFAGLVRFNGVRFEVFNSANTPLLPGGGIVNLHCDRAGRLWVSTYQGLAVLEGAQWRRLKKDDGWTGDYARTFTERANGDLLLTTFNGKVVQVSGDRLTELPSPPGDSSNGYFGCADEEGRWWVVQNGFIGRWDGGRWVKMISPPELPADAVGCARARDGGMWLALGNEVLKLLHGAEVERVRLPERPGGVWSMSEDHRGNVWISTHDRGVCRVAPSGEMLRWNATNGWSNHGRFVFEDREHNLWVGTSGDGLMRFKPRRFRTFGRESGLKETIVQSVCPADDGVWVGTYGNGVFRMGNAKLTNGGQAERVFRDSYVQSVLVDRAGRGWVGTFRDSIYLIDKQNIRQLSPDQTGGNNVLALFEDSHGRVWINGGEAVAIFDGNNNLKFGPEQGLPFSTVAAFAEDNQGAIWVSNGNGLFRRNQERFVEVRPENGESIRHITCLKAESDGTLWLGSRDRGLLRWRNGHLTSLAKAAAFPANSIHAIVEDDHGVFWMTSERGIVRARRSDLHTAMDSQSTRRLPCQVFDANDGLPPGEFTNGRQPVSTRDRRGRLWFATSKGVAMVDPAELRLNEAPPPTVIEGISYFQRTPKGAKNQNLSEGTSDVETLLRGPFAGRVSLPAGSRRITICYAALCFAAPEKVRFQVKLEGEDTDWVDASAQRFAYYHDLPPNDYRFRMRAANNDGLWNEAEASVVFTVQPFFWQAVWFQLLVALGLGAVAAGIVWTAIQGKLQNINERERAQEALKESEQRYREVVESQTDLVCRYQADTTLTFVNESYCRYFGKSRDVLIGSKFLDLIPRTAWSTVMKDIASLNQEHRVQTHEHEVILSDGSIGWQQWVNRPIVGPDGTVTEYQAIGRDISDRKHAEEARRNLAHATRVSTVGALAGSLAHELNQPLTAILSNAQAGTRFMRGPMPDLTEIQALLQDITEDSNRAGEVIRQLRVLIKKDEPQFEPLDLNRVIRDVVRLLHSDTVIKNIQIALHFDSELPPVGGDNVQLQQLMLNLLLNAFDAVKDVGEHERTIEICTRQADAGAALIEVKDCGTGIPPDLLARLFEPFNSTKRDGLGLGLSISRSIAEMHGGRLWAVNNADRGATFCFTVPGLKERKPGKTAGLGRAMQP